MKLKSKIFVRYMRLLKQTEMEKIAKMHPSHSFRKTDPNTG